MKTKNGKVMIVADKGERPGGRAKGTPNKITHEIKQAFLNAVTSVGADGKGTDGLEGYFRNIAIKRADLTMAMMGRLMPMEANVKHENHNVVDAAYETVADVLEEFKRRQIPLDMWPPLLRRAEEGKLKLVHDIKRDGAA